MSVHEIGLVDALKTPDYNFIDRDKAEDKRAAMLAAYDADVFLSSANAMTDDGILINIDGNSNRVSAIAQGPKKVIFIVILFFISLVALLLGVSLGSVDIPFIDTIKVFLHPLFPGIIDEPSEPYYSKFIFQGRLPRAALVILTGFALGISGMMMQGLLMTGSLSRSRRVSSEATLISLRSRSRDSKSSASLYGWMTSEAAIPLSMSSRA